MVDGKPYNPPDGDDEESKKTFYVPKHLRGNYGDEDDKPNPFNEPTVYFRRPKQESEKNVIKKEVLRVPEEHLALPSYMKFADTTKVSIGDMENPVCWWGATGM